MTTPKKVVLLGASGMLGSDFRKASESRSEMTLISPSSTEIDLSDPQSLTQLDSFLPIDAIVNAAAWNDVDGCESNELKALQINAHGPGRLANYCRDNDIYLLHISSDYVFDGKKSSPYLEEDPPNPINIYGRSKLAGEEFIAKAAPRHAILRTQWLYGHHGRNFVQTMLTLAREQSRVEVVDDQIGCPTFTQDLATWMLATLERKLTGTYHAVNRGNCSWFSFARKIFELAQINPPLQPTDSKRFHRPAPRPEDSRLENRKIEKALGISIRPWEEALADFFSSL